MIKIYTGKVGSGKTRALKKDIAEYKRDNFVCIDEGDLFLEDNRNFNLEQFLNYNKDLLITLHDPRTITKLICKEKREFIKIFTMSRLKD